MVRKFCLLAALVWAIAAVPSATAAPAAIEAPKDQAWLHANSGVSLPAALTGLPRIRLINYDGQQLDISAEYSPATGDEALSIYIYRNTNGGVPVWFAQAQWAIENRDIYRRPALFAGPVAFTPPGQSAATGLMAVYAPPEGGRFRSTGLMLFPVGDWYVKLRASSDKRTPEELAAWMQQALGEIVWPVGQSQTAAVLPVADCPTLLQFPKKAKDVKRDEVSALTASLEAALMGGAASQSKSAETETRPSLHWCRDAGFGPNQTIYRSAADDGDFGTQSYLMAIGDNGNAISVQLSFLSDIILDETKPKPPKSFSISLIKAGETSGYAAQDRLPSPQRVIEVINKGRPIAVSQTWGKNRTISISPK